MLAAGGIWCGLLSTHMCAQVLLIYASPYASMRNPSWSRVPGRVTLTWHGHTCVKCPHLHYLSRLPPQVATGLSWEFGINSWVRGGQGGGKTYRHGARTPAGSLSRENSFSGGGAPPVSGGGSRDAAAAAAEILTQQQQRRGGGGGGGAAGGRGGGDARAFGDESFDVGSDCPDTTMSFDVDEDLPGLGGRSGGGGGSVGGARAPPAAPPRSSVSAPAPMGLPRASPPAMGIVLDEDLEDIEDALRMGPTAAGAIESPAVPGGLQQGRLGRLSSSGGGGTSPTVRGAGGRPPLPRTPSAGSSQRSSSVERVSSSGVLPRPPPYGRSSGGGGPSGGGGGGGGQSAGGVSGLSSGFGDSMDSLPGMSVAEASAGVGGGGRQPRQVPLYDSEDEDEGGDGDGSRPASGLMGGGGGSGGPAGSYSKVYGGLEAEHSRTSVDSWDGLSVEGSEASLSMFAPDGVKPPSAGGSKRMP